MPEPLSLCWCGHTHVNFDTRTISYLCPECDECKGYNPVIYCGSAGQSAQAGGESAHASPDV